MCLLMRPPSTAVRYRTPDVGGVVRDLMWHLVGHGDPPGVISIIIPSVGDCQPRLIAYLQAIPIAESRET